MTDGSELDQAAVTAVRRGDAERYRELVERHERRVYAVAWSRLGDAALAEEVTQEAFIRAYRRLGLLGDGAKFSGWVATIARRLAINFGLRHRRELNRRERWALENNPEATPERSVEEDETPHSLETLRQTMAELPAAHRECLVLFHLEGRSGSEAAAILGISEAALRVRLHRARAALRERLEVKLERSLQSLRPAKSLVPAVMAGLLAPSFAKAAAAGGAGAATTVGLIAKTGLGKWLLPLGSFFSLVTVLPVLLASYLVALLELGNYRDPRGFRARLFRAGIKDRILLITAAIVVGLILIPVMARLFDRSGFSGLESESYCLLGGGLILALLLFALRQLVINRNRFFLASLGGNLLIGVACLLAGLSLLPPRAVILFVFAQGLLTLLVYGQRPARMDYNLFLRAAENLLPDSEPTPARRRRSKAELLGFARFLGTRWLVNQHHWDDEGLALRLTPANFSPWSELIHSRSFRKRSHLHLAWNGAVTASLGERDRCILAQLHPDTLALQPEWEARVRDAIATAWGKFAANDPAAAEHALGQVMEGEVFMVSPRKGGIARLRWLLAALLVVCLLGTLGLDLRGCRAQMEKLNGLHPVDLTPAQVDNFMSLVSTNPHPLVKTNLNGQEVMTRTGHNWDPGLALSYCLVLPETNRFTTAGLKAMRASIYGDDFNGLHQRPLPGRLALVSSGNSQWYRALRTGWVSFDDLNLKPADCEAWLHTNRFQHFSSTNWDRFLSRGESWSWVKRERFPVLRIQDWSVASLWFLRSANALDLVDREKLIQQIASVQTISATPPGQPPIHHWKNVRGLFHTPSRPTLLDTYQSLAALEILGGLDRIDREACIEGILKHHNGKGLFVSPDPGGYNEYKIQGDAQDTIAAYESLRILGALDRVQDLDEWQFRVNRRRLTDGEVTWRDIEAWLAQQRLQALVNERKAAPDTPWRSLREP